MTCMVASANTYDCNKQSLLKHAKIGLCYMASYSPTLPSVNTPRQVEMYIGAMSANMNVTNNLCSNMQRLVSAIALVISPA